MQATSTFTVSDFEPVDAPEQATAMPIGYSRMRKTYAGDATGTSLTLFTAAYDQAIGAGTYVAMEAFEGSLGGRAGAFAFIHSASTSGSDRANDYSLIVPGSGTAELAGITGRATLSIDADGTHHMDFDYELDA